MEHINTIIVEDDNLSMKNLELVLSKIDDVRLIESFTNGEDAIAHLKRNTCDLIFLDIEMPGLSGLEMVEQLQFLPQVVMTSSNKDYAYDAFELGIPDFMVKPINLQRVQQSIERYRLKRQQLRAISKFSSENEIYIKSDGQYIRIPVDEILYFENVGDFIKVISERGNFIMYGTLKALNQKLNHPRLLKIHRSFIINMGKIKNIKDGSVLMENDKHIPISRVHKPIVLSAINVVL